MSEDIDEPLEQAIEHAMALSAQLGREIARAWRQGMEQKAGQDQQRATAVRSAFESERATAAATLKPVLAPDWWDKASIPEVLNAYELANAWQDYDPYAGAAEGRLRAAAAERYGFDPAKLSQERGNITEHLKNTDPARLEQAQRWARVSRWHGPPSFYPEAQKLRTLLRDFDEAVLAEQRKARAREAGEIAVLGLEKEPTEGTTKAPVVMGTLEGVTAETLQQGHSAAAGTSARMDPVELNKATSWAIGFDPLFKAEIDAKRDQFNRDLIQRWQNAATTERKDGDVLARTAGQDTVAARSGMDDWAAITSAGNIHPDFATVEQAKEWARKNDPEFLSTMDLANDQLDRDLVARWTGRDDVAKAAHQQALDAYTGTNTQAPARATAALDAAQRSETLAVKEGTAAGAAYEKSDQFQSEADRLRSAGVPDKAVRAKQFGDSQQKFPVTHAAAGAGKKVGKIKTNHPEKAHAQGKQLGRSR